MHAPFDQPFPYGIYKQKYAHPGEEWNDTADRAVYHPLEALGLAGTDEHSRLRKLVRNRQFMPGGRYLYASGRGLHQVNNCFEGSTRFITRTGVRGLAEACGEEVEIRNRFGKWETATVQSFGEQELWRVTFANGDSVLTTENHLWWQENGTRKTTAELQEVPFSRVSEFPEIDPEGVRHGIIYGDGFLSNHGRYSKITFVNPEKDEALADWFEDEEKECTVGGGAVLKLRTKRALAAGTTIALQPAHYKTLPTECSPEYARGFIAGLIATDGCCSAGGSVTIAQEGLETAQAIAELAVLAGCVVNSVRVTNRISPFTGEMREMSTVSLKPYSVPVILPSHRSRIEARRLRQNFKMNLEVESVEATGIFAPVYCIVAPETESFTLANGLITSNCLLLRAEDTREGWSDLSRKASMALMTGAGIGVDYSEVRPSGSLISRTGGVASGPISLMKIINEIGRNVMQGGSRRSAIWAGLRWSHQDIFHFITAKDWSKEIRELKDKDFTFPADLDMTNISVILDKEFFDAFEDEDHLLHKHAFNVYYKTLNKMLTTAEPGFSVDYDNPRESLRNACTELVSEDDSDICNLGSLNMARFDTLEQFSSAVKDATLFLLAGSVYSDVPYDEVYEVRQKNRRLGLGIMGIHEWLLKRGRIYGPDEELGKWLDAYARSTEYAHDLASRFGLSPSVKTRAIAPTGTIGIIAETTTGIEPIFCAAYKRRIRNAHHNGDRVQHEYVVDPTAARLMSQGVDPNKIEDAYTLALDPERRIAFQAWVQQYVDHGISSTINIPSSINDPGDQADFGKTLMKYLPRLRGMTVYPDGARGGQPLTPVDPAYALEHQGVRLESTEDVCVGGVCGA